MGHPCRPIKDHKSRIANRRIHRIPPTTASNRNVLHLYIRMLASCMNGIGRLAESTCLRGALLPYQGRHLRMCSASASVPPDALSGGAGEGGAAVPAEANTGGKGMFKGYPSAVYKFTRPHTIRGRVTADRLTVFLYRVERTNTSRVCAKIGSCAGEGGGVVCRRGSERGPGQACRQSFLVCVLLAC